MAKDIARQEEDEFRGTPYTKKEAEEKTEQFVYSTVAIRHQLLDLYERRAHTALGYVSFEEYAAARLGMDMDSNGLSRLRRWASIEREMVDEYADKSKPTGLLDAIKQAKIKRAPALELAKLPTTELRRQAWAESQVTGAYDRSQMVQVKHVVASMLKNLGGNCEVPPPPAPIEPKAPTVGVCGNRTEGQFIEAVAHAMHEDAAQYGVHKAQIAPEGEAKPQNVLPATSEPTDAESAAEEALQARMSRWVSALSAAMSMVRMGRIDGKHAAQYRKDLSATMVKIGIWIAEGK